MNEDKVSIVVATKNEERNIVYCLKSIDSQTYDNIEMIVVDNESTDSTKNIARKYTKLVFDKGPERSSQRNYGMVDIAKGKFVMFVDADMILSPFLVEHCVEFIKRNNCIALQIPEIILGNSLWSKFRRFERGFYCGTVIDGARFFIKESFERVGGFDEHLNAAEDWDLDIRIKKNGTINLVETISMTDDALNKWCLSDFIKEQGVDPKDYSNVIFHNESIFKLRKYLEKKFYYTNSFNSYIEKWGKNHHDIKMQFGLVYRYFYVFLEKGKWKKTISKPHLIAGVYLLRFLVGLVYLRSKYSGKR
jgi:glycosyltransferase involved in cell wall biosynthesis